MKGNAACVVHSIRICARQSRGRPPHLGAAKQKLTKCFERAQSLPHGRGSVKSACRAARVSKRLDLSAQDISSRLLSYFEVRAQEATDECCQNNTSTGFRSGGAYTISGLRAQPAPLPSRLGT